MNAETLSKILESRASRCVELSNGLLSKGHFHIAGSAIASDTIRDIDVYPVSGKPFAAPLEGRIVETKNAVTIKNDPPIQFCNLQKPSLESLLSAFDFSHVQAGVTIEDGNVTEVKWTEAFLFAKASGSSSFTGSEYPLSSAIRLLKYSRRGEITERSSLTAILSIICAITERGFKSYDDFKDQLDAVDLGLVPEQYNEASQYVRRLYNALGPSIIDVE